MSKRVESDRPIAELILEGLKDPGHPTIARVADGLREGLHGAPLSLDALEALVRRDPVIVAWLIREANADAYHGLKRVTSLRQALARLEAERACAIVAELVKTSVFASDNAMLQECMEAVWRHAAAAAVVCRELARVTHYESVETAYLAGLVHHIGRIYVTYAIHGLAAKHEPIAEMSAHLFEEIQQTLSLQVATDLLQAWSFPLTVVEAMAQQRDPAAIPVGARLPWILQAADLICKKTGYGGFGHEPDLLLTNTLAMQELHLKDLDIGCLLVALEDMEDELRLP